MSTLYHYTCRHGREAIGERGRVVSIADHTPDAVDRLDPSFRWLAFLTWFTDMYPPNARDLGLTHDLIGCDRTAYRYRVLDDRGISRWLDCRPVWPPTARLLNASGTPGRWFVGWSPVPVELVTT